MTDCNTKQEYEHLLDVECRSLVNNGRVIYKNSPRLLLEKLIDAFDHKTDENTFDENELQRLFTEFVHSHSPSDDPYTSYPQDYSKFKNRWVLQGRPVPVSSIEQVHFTIPDGLPYKGKVFVMHSGNKILVPKENVYETGVAQVPFLRGRLTGENLKNCVKENFYLRGESISLIPRQSTESDSSVVVSGGRSSNNNVIGSVSPNGSGGGGAVNLLLPAQPLQNSLAQLLQGAHNHPITFNIIQGDQNNGDHFQGDQNNHGPTNPEANPDEPSNSDLLQEIHGARRDIDQVNNNVTSTLRKQQPPASASRPNVAPRNMGDVFTTADENAPFSPERDETHSHGVSVDVLEPTVRPLLDKYSSPEEAAQQKEAAMKASDEARFLQLKAITSLKLGKDKDKHDPDGDVLANLDERIIRFDAQSFPPLSFFEEHGDVIFFSESRDVCVYNLLELNSAVEAYWLPAGGYCYHNEIEFDDVALGIRWIKTADPSPSVTFLLSHYDCYQVDLDGSKKIPGAVDNEAGPLVIAPENLQLNRKNITFSGVVFTQQQAAVLCHVAKNLTLKNCVFETGAYLSFYTPFFQASDSAILQTLVCRRSYPFTERESLHCLEWFEPVHCDFVLADEDSVTAFLEQRKVFRELKLHGVRIYGGNFSPMRWLIIDYNECDEGGQGRALVAKLMKKVFFDALKTQNGESTFDSMKGKMLMNLSKDIKNIDWPFVLLTDPKFVSDMIAFVQSVAFGQLSWGDDEESDDDDDEESVGAGDLEAPQPPEFSQVWLEAANPTTVRCGTCMICIKGGICLLCGEWPCPNDECGTRNRAQRCECGMERPGWRCADPHCGGMFNEATSQECWSCHNAKGVSAGAAAAGAIGPNGFSFAAPSEQAPVEDVGAAAPGAIGSNGFFFCAPSEQAPVEDVGAAAPGAIGSNGGFSFAAPSEQAPVEDSKIAAVSVDELDIEEEDVGQGGNHNSINNEEEADDDLAQHGNDEVEVDAADELPVDPAPHPNMEPRRRSRRNLFLGPEIDRQDNPDDYARSQARQV